MLTSASGSAVHARLQLRYRWGHLVTGDWTGSETLSLKKETHDCMKLLAELPACPVAISTNTISIACERGAVGWLPDWARWVPVANVCI